MKNITQIMWTYYNIIYNYKKTIIVIIAENAGEWQSLTYQLNIKNTHNENSTRMKMLEYFPELISKTKYITLFSTTFLLRTHDLFFQMLKRHFHIWQTEIHENAFKRNKQYLIQLQSQSIYSALQLPPRCPKSTHGALQSISDP